MGDFIDATEKLEVEVFTADVHQVPGLGWELSDTARDAMRAIDENIRAAEQISGQLTVG